MTEPPIDDPRALSLVDLASALRRGLISSEAVVRAYLDRIEAVNPALNAVVHLRREAALDEARAADRVPPDDRPLLHGVPVTIKDSLDTAGVVTTAGTLGRAGHVPAADATAVARLRAAGAIVLGKTNTPDLTLGFETTNLVHGRTNNPYDPARTAGGSSGGAAAIVAVGGSPLDVGSDTGGSIRVPAHCCGVAGHKPTAGRVPRTGHVVSFDGATERLTQLGPLARRVEDLALALSAIAGPDGVDPQVPPVPMFDYLAVDVGALAVGYFVDLPPLVPTPETAAAVERSVRALADAGCRVGPVTLPGSESIYEEYTGLFWGDGGASVARLLARCGTTESPLFDRIRHAPTDTPAALTDRHERWDRWRSRLLAHFAEYDALVCPVYVGPAPLHGAFHRASGAYTQWVNLAGWPSTVVRAGTSPEGLPIGVQCVAKPWREDISLAVAARVEARLRAWAGPALG